MPATTVRDDRSTITTTKSPFCGGHRFPAINRQLKVYTVGHYMLCCLFVARCAPTLTTCLFTACCALTLTPCSWFTFWCNAQNKTGMNTSTTAGFTELRQGFSFGQSAKHASRRWDALATAFVHGSPHDVGIIQTSTLVGVRSVGR